MDLRQLRYFLAIVDEGAFSRAAQRLRVAQPALSLHVRRMEEALGVPLLTRSAAGAAPTEEGRLLAARARALLADFAAMQDELRSRGQAPSGTVRIGLPGTLSAILSVPLIAGLHARFPKIKLIVAEAMSGFVADWLREGEADLGLIYGEVRDARLTCEALLDEELYLLHPPGAAPLPGPATPQALAALPLILPSASHGLRRQLEAAAPGLHPRIEIDSYASIKRLVAGGFGCSVLPHQAIRDELAQGALGALPFAGGGLWRRAYLAAGAARPPSRAAAAVRDEIRTIARALIAEGSWSGARAC